MEDTAILLLAAGGSERMRGADKLLEMIDGEAVLRRQARAALGAGGPVLVCLAPNRPERKKALQGLAVRHVTVGDAAEGMPASIRAGVAALPDGVPGVAILPADMPEITGPDLAAVLAVFRRHPHSAVRATADSGAAGHPVVFPARLFGALLALKGDQGARAVLAGEKVFPVALPENHATTDLDTPEDWAKWRAARQP